MRLRKKLRIRYYETEDIFTEDKPVFVEIKQRVDRVTQKRRIVLPYFQALQICNDRCLPDVQATNKEIFEEIYAFVWSYNLRPASIVRYARTAFISKRFDIGLRVTFDKEIMCQPNPLHLHEQLTGIPLLGANMVIMEIKVNERIPIWLTQMVAEHNLKITPFSKYCRSIAATGAMPYMYKVRMPAESSMDILSSSYSVFQDRKNELTKRRNY
jgi:SPX domain protein involved in polyphosphate accumulation